MKNKTKEKIVTEAEVKAVESVDQLPEGTKTMSPEPLNQDQLRQALGQRFDDFKQQLIEVNRRIAFNLKDLQDAQDNIDRDSTESTRITAQMGELQVIFNSITPVNERGQIAQK